MKNITNTITNDDFLALLKNALYDKNINNYEFKILVYIFNNNDFLVTDIKKDLKISSFNMISKFIKNLVNQKYIIKESKHIKNEKNKSSYNYFINTEKLNIQNNNNDFIKSPLYGAYSLYYYFFEKIPTKRKIDKSINLQQITLLLELDNYDLNYLKTLIDFVSQNENLKSLYSRPILFRKNIKEIINFFENQNQQAKEK